MDLGISTLIILGAPFGSNFSLIESIPVRVGMVIFLILASKQSFELSGFLAALAVFTLVLERNHEILSNYDTSRISKPLSQPTNLVYTQVPIPNETEHTINSTDDNEASDLKDNIPRY